MIFAYIWHVMRVALRLSGLAALLCAQSATAWKWYGYGENNSSNLCAPLSNNGNGRLGVVRVLGDTVYVMGTYQRRGTFSSPLPLPKVPGDPTTASATTPGNFNTNTSTYLAAYDRQTGHILWWMSFRPFLPTFDDYVEGQDFVVRPDGRIYLLIHTNVSANFEWDYQSASASSANGTFDISRFFTFIPSANRVSSILEINPGSSPSVQVRRAIGVTDVAGEVHLKYLYYIQDTLYVTGDYIVQGLGPWALSDVPGFSLFCYDPPGCNTSGSNQWRGLVIGYQTTGSWTLIRAAEVRYESGGAYEPVKGHRLARDPVSGQLRWVIEVAQSGPKSLIYNVNPGGTGSDFITPGPLSPPPVTTLYAISLNPDLSLPPPRQTIISWPSGAPPVWLQNLSL